MRAFDPHHHPAAFTKGPRPLKTKKQGNPVGKATKVAGKRIGGALRSEHAREQARRDSR